jgi:hypothetical protein
MSDPSPSPKRGPNSANPTRANIARVYDAFLGGQDNYEIDRQVLRSAAKAAPEVRDMATENRGFLIRMCRFLAAEAGISQFLDCGSGLPTAENTHQVVQRTNPDARVVYVDNDPVVVAHGRALLEENDNTHFASADIFNPREVIGNEVVREHIDFSKPLAFLQLGTLHHHEGSREWPAEIMQEYVNALPSGSYVAISHFFDPENEHSELARKLEHVLRHSPMGSGTFRTMNELEQLLPGLELVAPGLTLCADWRPERSRVKPLSQAMYCVAGGVGRKP